MIMPFVGVLVRAVCHLLHVLFAMHVQQRDSSSGCWLGQWYPHVVLGTGG
jgi:hypothetical protein